MVKGIDHIVLAAHSLQGAAACWEALGFKLTPIARHPWGTENRLVQLDSSFLEVLSIGEGAQIEPSTAQVLSFGGFNQQFLEKREGASMFVLDSSGAEEDRAQFRRAGLPLFEPFSFERVAIAPDGSQRPVAFDLTFTRDPLSPELSFFTCHNKFPENFWKPEYQVHPNSVTDLIEAVFVADDPADHHEFLKAFVGQKEARLSSLGVELQSARGVIRVLSPNAYESLYGLVPQAGASGLSLEALRFKASDLSTFSSYAQAMGGQERDGSWVIGPDHLAGVAVLCD